MRTRRSLKNRSAARVACDDFTPKICTLLGGMGYSLFLTHAPRYRRCVVLSWFVRRCGGEARFAAGSARERQVPADWTISRRPRRRRGGRTIAAEHILLRRHRG